MWRVVREGRAVFDGSRASGRWNPSQLSVLYGARQADGAVAEIHFHLSQGQSVFPSRIRHVLHELEVATDRTLVLANMSQLVALGVEEARYNEILYARTQEIADAAAFIGFDGIIAPSARWPCENIVLFLDAFKLEDASIVGETPVNWKSWRMKHRR